MLKQRSLGVFIFKILFVSIGKLSIKTKLMQTNFIHSIYNPMTHIVTIVVSIALV